MSKKIVAKNLSKPNPDLLKAVPYEKGFHFFTEHGAYTGITATSLAEFEGKLKTIPVQSVKFHFLRGDYQNWFVDVVGDEEIAKRIDQIKEKSLSSDEDLRKELLEVAQNRIAELTVS